MGGTAVFCDAVVSAACQRTGDRGGHAAAEAAMTLTKNVSGPSAGGTYTITMEAQATGKESTVATQEPMDVVLVLDVSGSMG